MKDIAINTILKQIPVTAVILHRHVGLSLPVPAAAPFPQRHLLTMFAEPELLCKSMWRTWANPGSGYLLLIPGQSPAFPLCSTGVCRRSCASPHQIKE